MKILFCQLPTSHYGAREKVYPLGLSRLSSLAPEGCQKMGLDMNLYPDPWPGFEELLRDFEPDTICLSFRNLDPLAGEKVSYISSLKIAVRIIKGLLPQAKIILGGPGFSMFPNRIMGEIPEVHMGVIGEGEGAFLDLISKDLRPRDVRGMIYREGWDLIYHKDRGYFNINKLPPLDLELFPPRDYYSINSYVAAMGIEAKRGCSYSCSYCVYPALSGSMVRIRDPGLVVDEMELLNKDYKIELFHFTDPVLNFPEVHFLSICQEIIKRRLKVNWTGFFREDHVTEELINIAKEAGLITIYFSGDALYEKGLRILNKKMELSQIIDAARIAAKSRIITVYHFLLNLPFEDDKDRREAREVLMEILNLHIPYRNLGAVVFNNIRLYPDAPITERLTKDGLIPEDLDLLYPTYYDPLPTAKFYHELDAMAKEHCSLMRLTYPYLEA